MRIFWGWLWRLTSVLVSLNSPYWVIPTWNPAPIQWEAQAAQDVTCRHFNRQLHLSPPFKWRKCRCQTQEQRHLLTLLVPAIWASLAETLPTVSCLNSGPIFPESIVHSIHFMLPSLMWVCYTAIDDLNPSHAVSRYHYSPWFRDKYIGALMVDENSSDQKNWLSPSMCTILHRSSHLMHKKLK